MVNKDFFQALDELEAQKGIKKEFFIQALESALTSAYKKNFGEAKNAEVKLLPEKSTIKVYSYKKVVETVEDPDKEVSLEDAVKVKKTYKVGDIIANEETPKNFGRIAAQTAKQVVMQRLREAERSRIMDEISTKQDELITGIVRKIEPENVYVDLGLTQIEGVLGQRDRIGDERFTLNARIKVYVRAVKENFNMPYVQLTRSNIGFVKRLFELEIPEIQSGEVIIKNIVREAGYRTKIAVWSPSENIDAVGACVGNKGMRVNSIVSELNGEKVDIIRWSDNPAEFIAASLSPATVSQVRLDIINKTSLAIVPDEKLSLAIGKSGQNVRLAAKLTGWKIDVKAKSKMEEAKDDEDEEDRENAENLEVETPSDLK